MTSDSRTQNRKQRRNPRFNWTPYLLILPSLIYLAVFFAWPMVRGLNLAVREDGAALELLGKAQRDSPAIPADLSELSSWTDSIAPQVVIADKALRVAAKTEHNEVPKIIASLQALRDLYWNAKFGEDDNREEANDQWRRFLMQNRMTFSPVGKAAETGRYEDEYKAVVDGVTYTAKMHISGNSTHDPLRCLRIYVVEDRINERIVVTHLPTHLTNSLT